MVKVYYNQFKKPMKSANTGRPSTRHGPPGDLGLHGEGRKPFRPTRKLTGEALRQQRIRQRNIKERKEQAEEEEAKEVGVDVKTLRRLKLRGFKHKSLAEAEREDRKRMIEGLKKAGGVNERNIRELAKQRKFQKEHPHHRPERDDIRHSVKNIGQNIKQHPVQSAILGGSLVLGLGATLLSGGILGPEVAEGLAVESDALLGTEMGVNSEIEMTDLTASSLNTSARATEEAKDFIDVSQVSKLPKSQLAVGTENIESDMNVINDFKSVEIGQAEPEVPEFIKSQQVAQEVAQDEEVILDVSGKPTAFEEPVVEPEPVEAPKPVNQEADAVEVQGAVNNSSQFEEEELFEKTINLNKQPPISQAEIDEIEEMVEIGVNNREVATRVIQKLSKYGARGVKFLSKNIERLSKVLLVAGVSVSTIESVRRIAKAKTAKGKLEAFEDTIDGLNEINKAVTGKEHEGLSDAKRAIQKGNKELEEIKKQTEELKKETERVIDATKNVLNVDKEIRDELIKSDKNNTEQLKEIVKENRVETEAIKHNEVKLSNELQQIKQEEKKEIDTLEAIKNVIDRPTTEADFLLALKNYETQEGKFEFLSEHYDTLITFDNRAIQQILSVFS